MQTAPTSTTSRVARRLAQCATGLALLTYGGCAGAVDDDVAAEIAAQVSGVMLDAGTSGADLGTSSADAGGAADAGSASYTAEVTATGSGCPEGSWEAHVSEDSSHFSISYLAHDVEVDDKVHNAQKECTLSIRLRAQSGLSFAVEKYAHSGFAMVEKGARGKQTSTFWFDGVRITSRSRNTYFEGPFDDGYKSEPLKESDQFWTPCALERTLLVVTRVQLSNGDTNAKGFAAVTSAEGAGTRDVELAIAARPCTLPPPPATR